MPESRAQGPGGYAEVSATAGAPRPQAGPAQPAPGATPFTPPDISALGDGAAAGGAAQTKGGGLAHAISFGGQLIKMLPEAAEAAAL